MMSNSEALALLHSPFGNWFFLNEEIINKLSPNVYKFREGETETYKNNRKV
jgi:hypothetical protein